MAAGKEYYDILGLKKDASADEVKKAFRGMARKHHPDAGGDEEKFKEINEAYEVLSDSEKRAQYDQYGQYFGGNAPPGYGGAGAGWPGGGASGYQNVNMGDIGDIGDIFGSVFGGGMGGGAQKRAHRGTDLSYEVTLTWDEALEGVSTKVDVQRAAKCGTCHGSGAKPGTSPTTCPTCRGSGNVSQGQGLFGFSRPCQRCSGTGTIIEHPCSACRGKGRVVRVKPITVNVPPGVSDGGKIRFSGKGQPGEGGGPAGDLYVVTKIKPHAFYTRDGADVHMELPLTVAEAALGTQVVIPTPVGDTVKLKIKPGTQDNKVIRLKGKGAPRLKGKGRGDLKVRTRIVVPTGLSAQDKSLLEQFAESHQEDVRAHIA